MSEYLVNQLEKNFKSYWNGFLAISPHLELDDSWPSIGTIDLLTYCLRLKEDSPKELNELVRGASVYLAQMGKRCLSTLVHEIGVSLEEDGIHLTATGGEWIPAGSRIDFAVERILRSRLLEVPYPFPVAPNFKKQISFDANIVSLIGLGVTTGMLPDQEGAWAGMPPDQLEHCVKSAVKELARSSADRYARLFPKEPLGQMAELYLCKLIYPPTMMQEELPFLGTVAELGEFFSEYKISRESVALLGKNLARSPDEQISCAGIVLYGALAKGKPDAAVLASALSRGNFPGLLRRAMIAMRQHFGLQEDWIESGLQDSAAVERFHFERAFNFIPWLTLSASRVRKDARTKKLTPLLVALSDFDIEGAISINDRLLQDDMSDLELRLQRVKLEMTRGDLDRADSMFHELMSESGSDESPEFYNLWGMCALGRNKADNAVSYFKAALSLPCADPEVKSNLANNYSWACLATGDLVSALEAADLGISTSICPVTLMLNKCSILWQLKRFDEFAALRKMLFSLAPADRRVFANLTLTDSVISILTQ